MAGFSMVESPAQVVIIGAGHAGCQLAFSLRDKGFTGQIALVNGEPEQPYQRPPLSKAYMERGQADILWFRQAEAYAARNIRLVSGQATAVDREARTVTLGDNTEIAYNHLVFATGTRTRPLPEILLDQGLRTLKTLKDAEKLRCALSKAQSLCIIGAGFIGLELASYASRLGKRVEIVESGVRPMARAVSGSISAYFLNRHRAAGVTFHLGRLIRSVNRTDGRTILTLDDGTVVEADVVVAAIGVTAEVGLAQAAGLDVDDGILVDRHLQTKDPAISAIGDCARYPSVHAGTSLRLESVQNANDHARLLADRLTGGTAVYEALPWFWSDQGTDKLQIAGLPGPAEREVLRGTPESGRFSVFSLRQGRLFAAESVNMPADHMMARRLISAGDFVDAEALGDPDIPHRALLKERKET